MNVQNLIGNLYEADLNDTNYYSKQVIYFILEGSSALLIDTGYEAEMLELKTYLDSKQISIEKIIISHYHDDHFTGLKVLSDIKQNLTILGSSEFSKTLEIEYKDDFLYDRDIYPTVFCEELQFEYGGHQIRFDKAKGHSECCLHTIIDETYIHTADDIIFTTDNTSLLPLPCQSIMDQLATLANLKKYVNGIYLGSHFSAGLNNVKDMKAEIDARIGYLHKILEYKGDVEYDIIKNMFPVEFNPRWHGLVLGYYKEQLR